MSLVNVEYIKDVALVRMANDKKLNALSTKFIDELYDKLSEVESRAKVMVITGGDKAFAAGVDITEIAALSSEDAYLQDFINEKWEKLYTMKVPTIAAVSGYAIGGGFELALMCDMIVATDGAKFGFPEINLGLMPGLGGTQFLAKAVGTKIASELIYTGRLITSAQAYDLKIISKLVKQEELLEKSLELAENISTKSLLSLKMIKDAMRLSQNTFLDQAMKSERQMFRSLFSTSGKIDGVREFLHKKR